MHFPHELHTSEAKGEAKTFARPESPLTLKILFLTIPKQGNNYAENFFSLVLLMQFMMPYMDEEILDPMMFEGESAKGVRRKLRKRKNDGELDPGVYMLLIAKLKEDEGKEESEERLRQHLNQIIRKKQSTFFTITTTYQKKTTHTQ